MRIKEYKMRQAKANLAKVDLRTHAPAVVAQLRFKGGRCLPLTFFPDFSGQFFHQVQVGDGWLELPGLPQPLPAHWQDYQTHLKPGVSTRADLEKFFYVDGGLATFFRDERYVLSGTTLGDKVLKINIAFRPANITEAAFNVEILGGLSGDSGGISKTQSPKDVIIRMSPVYADYAYCD